MEKKDIVKILMKRDHMTLDEAWRVINDTQEEIDYVIADGNFMLDDIEDIIKVNLGLEPDYLDAFLAW